MTAETVVLNRSGVALAADSAATLLTGRGAKVTNNADKLFQLCHTEPVGIMIFGNSEFMDMPFEPIIKQFRNCSLSNRKKHVGHYAEAFFKYLETQVNIDTETANNHISSTFMTALSPYLKRALDRLLKSRAKKSGSIADNMGEFFLEELSNGIDYLKKEEDCPCMDTHTAEELADLYKPQVNDALNYHVRNNPPSEAVMQRMLDASYVFIGLFLKKSIFSEQSTGIAFAGFGSDDHFPSLYVFDTEGLVAGHVKRRLTEKVCISPNGQRGYIAPLAQDDIVKRYVEGIDPGLSDEIAERLSEMMAAFGEGLATQWLRGAKRKNAVAHAVSAAEMAASEFIKLVIGRSREWERKEITDVVHHMSKSELAQLAEALVEMTALRRRVSLDVETVGGPIDVAVISKGDGFVWIKRKHYFDPELNSRYFATKINTIISGSCENETRATTNRSARAKPAGRSSS